MKSYILGFSAIFAIIFICTLFFSLLKKGENSHSPHIAVVMTGLRNTGSWNEIHYEALGEVSKKLNVKIDYYENVPSDSTSKFIIEKAIKNGANVLFLTSYNFKNIAIDMALKHPEVKIFHAMGESILPNLSPYYGRIYLMRYLAGMVAGLMTKTNEIGYVGSYFIPGVTRGINAFTLGVKRVNPKAKVFVSWSNTWDDEFMVLDATRELFQKHSIDILTAHIDAISAFKIADERNVWIIGNNKDLSSRFPKNFLTAPIWKWENFYEARINEITTGKYKAKGYWEGADLVDLAPMTKNVPDSIKQIILDEKERIINGEIAIFKGPIKDNQGHIRVESGDIMTDIDLIKNFDWFVNGVEDGFEK